MVLVIFQENSRIERNTAINIMKRMVTEQTRPAADTVTDFWNTNVYNNQGKGNLKYRIWLILEAWKNFNIIAKKNLMLFSSAVENFCIVKLWKIISALYQNSKPFRTVIQGLKIYHTATIICLSFANYKISKAIQISNKLLPAITKFA